MRSFFWKNSMQTYQHNNKLTQFSRINRKHQTDAEKLWYHLRNKQLGWKFHRQYPISSYILDFYCIEKKIAIELDGHPNPLLVRRGRKIRKSY